VGWGKATKSGQLANVHSSFSLVFLILLVGKKKIKLKSERRKFKFNFKITNVFRKFSENMKRGKVEQEIPDADVSRGSPEKIIVGPFHKQIPRG
jgi:hypothetical protein